MDTPFLKKILAGEHAEDLEAQEAREFMERLNSSPDVRDELTRMEQDVEQLKQLFEPTLPGPEQWTRVTEAIRSEMAANPIQPRQHNRQRRGFPVLLAVAASLLFLAGVAFLSQAQLDGSGGDGGQVSMVNLAKTDQVEALMVEPGPGYEAGNYVAEGELLCIWVRKKP